MRAKQGVVVARGRGRRRHSEEFKAEAVRACAQPGVSLASVALAREINANLLRRWVVQRSSTGRALTASQPRSVSTPSESAAFIPLALAQPALAEVADIRIEIKRGATRIKVSWPAAVAGECAVWLRELLR